MREGDMLTVALLRNAFPSVRNERILTLIFMLNCVISAAEGNVQN